MNNEILQRIRRIYASIDAIEERDSNKLRATVKQTDKYIFVLQDFRGGFSDEELLNQAHTVISNIANLKNHLKKWARLNGLDNNKIGGAVDNCFELQIIIDLSNNDKHGYPPRDGGHSKRSPQLIGINRIMRLQTQAKKGSMISITIGHDGTPRTIGNGTAKAVITGDVIDKGNNHIGDLYDIANKALEAWESLLSEFGLA